MQKELHQILQMEVVHKADHIHLPFFLSSSFMMFLHRHRHLPICQTSPTTRGLPQKLFYGELVESQRSIGRLRKCFKASLKDCGIDPEIWESFTHDHLLWRRSIHDGIVHFEEECSSCITKSRLCRKDPSNAASTGLACHLCARPCVNKARLVAHLRLHHTGYANHQAM